MSNTDSENSAKAKVAKMPHGNSSKRSEATAKIFGEMRHDPEKIRELFREGKYPYKTKIRKGAYEHHKELQVELLKVQNWVKTTGERVVVLMEGSGRQGRDDQALT